MSTTEAAASASTEAIVVNLAPGKSITIPKGSLFQVAFVENVSRARGNLGLQQGASHIIVTMLPGKTLKINLTGNGATLTNDGPPPLIVKY
ncbi:MAG: hypothetical protein QOF89_1444 [Acidobacteriota bacterium]|jgi:hypothetical protein|nr:hypothetical protein [Acidobacteriota bacterium]